MNIVLGFLSMMTKPELNPSRLRAVFMVVVGLMSFSNANLWAAEERAATPHDFVRLYAAASASKSAEAVASYYGPEVRSVPYQGEPYIMTGKDEQQALLGGFFDGLAGRGIENLTLSDYAITQISDHFAFTRLRWELVRADGTIANTINSTYVIRLEQDGWRVATILEMGKPHGP